MTVFYFVAIIAISCISIVELSPQPGIFGDVVKNLGIYPGTKWCGPGNIAENFDDLGTNEEVDKCCRTHDHCPHRIRSGDTKYNFHNEMKFTISECECEKELKSCLNNSDKGTLSSSKFIRLLYFAVKTQCFNLVNGDAVLMDSYKYQQNTTQKDVETKNSDQ